MNLDLSDDEAAALARSLRRMIDEDRYPLSPRLAPLKVFLAKPEPEPSRQVLPPPKARMASCGAGRRRRRG
jgi:hypothetical protein